MATRGEVYWRLAEGGQSTVQPADLLGFFAQAVESGKVPAQWSEAVSIKVARGIVAAWEGFRLVGPRSRGSHQILGYRVRDDMCVYLAYQLHFEGHSDSEVVRHPDWQIFGLKASDVRHRLHGLSNGGWWELKLAET